MPTSIIANASASVVRLLVANASSDAERRLDNADTVLPIPADRPSTVRAIAKLSTFQNRARRELAGYFARVQAGATPTASDATIEANLASISGYHRGVLSLHYSARVWPETVTKALHGYASLAIRLYCADHPATGSTSALENAAAEQLAAKAAIAQTDKKAEETLLDLHVRAGSHYDRAIRAYAKGARRRALEANAVGGCCLEAPSCT